MDQRVGGDAVSPIVMAARTSRKAAARMHTHDGLSSS
jgi:hypothetical protein